MNTIQRLDLLAPVNNVLSVPGLVAVWDGSDPRNGGVGLADGDGITILENTADPRPSFYDPFTTALREGWTNVAGTLAVTGGTKGYFSSDANGDLAVRETGLADCVVSCRINGDLNGAGYSIPQVVFRYADVDNFLYVSNDNTRIYLNKFDGGVFASLTNAASTTSDNTDYTIGIEANGNSIVVKVDGATKITYTLSGGNTKYSAYTKHGVRLSKGGTPSYTATWDNFIVAKLTDAIQTTAANKFTFKTNIRNGRAIARADGGDFMTVADVEMHSNTLGMTVYVVRKATSTSSAKGLVTKYNATAGARGWGMYTDQWQAQANPASFNADNQVTIADSTDWRIDVGVWSPSAFSQAYNSGALVGSAVTPAASLADTSEPVRLGCSGDALTFFTGDKAEGRVYNVAHTPAQMRRVMRYLSRKWGLPLTA